MTSKTIYTCDLCQKECWPFMRVPSSFGRWRVNAECDIIESDEIIEVCSSCYDILNAVYTTLISHLQTGAIYLETEFRGLEGKERTIYIAQKAIKKIT